MSEVKRIDIDHKGLPFTDNNGAYVFYEDYAALEAKCAALTAENSILNLSRTVLSENVLEACNAIASAGFRNKAIMKGFYASTGNGNKYPNPISTMVDEALSELSIPATDAFLAEVRAQGVEMLAKNHQSIVNALKGDSLFSDGEYRHAAIVSAAVYFAAELRKGGNQK